MLNRRSVLRGATALGLGGIYLGGPAWSRTDARVRAIIPAASADRLAVKVLLATPPALAPQLTLDGRAVAARMLDPDGYAWGFVQPGLEANRAYRLELADAGGAALREGWSLRTLPGPQERPERFRVLLFTCAGGDEAASFLPLATRQALLDRALAFEPDLAVAIGDHVYWDLDTALKYRADPARRAETAAFYRSIAWIDQDSAFDSVTNRQSLNTIVGRQIAALYEDRFASVPMVFVADDHDYYENDNGGEWGYSFPPRPFILGLQRRTAAMAYPYALGRPELPGGAWTSETVESVRIGRLGELSLVDCRRGWDTATGNGVLFPEVERYLLERLADPRADHHVYVPSNPMGWTAGKIGEWYEDRPPASVTSSDKGYWPAAWFEQHQRLITALSGQRGRPAITVSGDLHASGAKRVTASGALDLTGNPLDAILAGPVSTGATGWPSIGRGMFPATPTKLAASDTIPTEERNGFTLLDLTPERVEVRQFRWRPPEPLEAIAALQPHASFSIERRS